MRITRFAFRVVTGNK